MQLSPRATVTVATTTADGEEITAGTLYCSGDDLTFRYSGSYLERNGATPLFPSLPLSSASYYFHGLGPFSDAAPDRWGRKVLARDLKRTRLTESEYLLGVNDLTRQGALRFLDDGVPLAGEEGVPVLANLPELLNTADAVEEGREIDDTELRRLYRATGSLGGARPKASVMDRNTLWLAKFPKPNGDEWDVIGWEAVTLEIAAMAGIDVPEHRTVGIADVNGNQRTVLLTERFDRLGGSAPDTMQRIPYMSAMTALEAVDGEGGDWLDLAEETRTLGADTVQLWKRAMFGAAIGNLDDHLRNHGFLRLAPGDGWQLAPAFDLNPEPWDDHAGDSHQLALFGDAEVTVGRLMGDDSLSLFGVTPVEAAQWLPILRSAVSQMMPRASLRHVDNQSRSVMESRLGHALSVLDEL
ncbi:type II toxin-antitoxin system HipA family toxin [Bifidobacterium sp. BRDM6]|uniref:Type II toxin-antitoxin system HipA family toxin n=2 Tax=Bifidobacterium choloepi TaxID=2614131 RepID=A0A6I5N1G0_9BIFI|nr:type II toxin-antitoxin system HipA family toxin [Bifidobacterium choloepi]